VAVSSSKVLTARRRRARLMSDAPQSVPPPVPIPEPSEPPALQERPRPVRTIPAGVPNTQPIPIALVMEDTVPRLQQVRLGPFRRRLDLGRICEALNRAQGAFEYILLPEPVTYRDLTMLLPHQYGDEQHWALLVNAFQARRVVYNFGILIVTRELADSSFNRHNEASGLGIITLYQHQTYLPPLVDSEQYLMYLILCETYCIVGQRHFEHAEVRYCLFDMCNNKLDFIDCISAPLICKRCLTALAEVGFEQEQIEASQGPFEVIAKQRWYSALGHGLGDPRAIFFLGIYASLMGSLAAQSHPLLALLGGQLVACTYIVVVLRRLKR